MECGCKTPRSPLWAHGWKTCSSSPTWMVSPSRTCFGWRPSRLPSAGNWTNRPAESDPGPSPWSPSRPPPPTWKARPVMLKKPERVALIQRRLDELYPETPIPLDHRDAYTLLIAVLLSAQCTDARVNQVTPELFALADNPVDMVAQEVAAIEDIVRPCGLGPRKARAIHELSRIRSEERRVGEEGGLDCVHAREASGSLG